MENQKPISKEGPIQGKTQHNISWFLNQIAESPVFEGCKVEIKAYDDASGGCLQIDQSWENQEFSERLANVFRPDLGGTLHVSFHTKDETCELSFSTLTHPVIQELYKWFKDNEKKLEIKKICGHHIGLGEVEYKDDSPYVDGLKIFFDINPNDTKAYEKKAKELSNVINEMIEMIEKANQQIEIDFSEENLSEISSIIELWLKKKSFKRCKYTKNLKPGNVYYISSTGGRDKHNGDYSMRMNRIIRGRNYRWAVSAVYFFHRGLLLFRMDVCEKYRIKLKKIYYYLESNASEFGIEKVENAKYFKKENELKIVFTDITSTNYKDRLEEALATIDKAIKMF